MAARERHLMGSPDPEDDMELNEKVMIFIVMASEIFKKKSSAILRQYGLTFSYYNVLKHLVACGQGQDTIGNVSKKMLVTAANMTGVAKRMEKAGLIEKKNDAQDERLRMLQITRRGRETLGAIREIQEQHGGAYLEIYSLKEKEEVLSVLKHIVRRGKQLPNSISRTMALRWQLHNDWKEAHVPWK